jgi:hypothetical protein
MPRSFNARVMASSVVTSGYQQAAVINADADGSHGNGHLYEREFLWVFARIRPPTPAVRHP